MAIQVIDNFLERDDFMFVKDALMGDEIPWFYNDCVSDMGDKECYFTHRFYNEEVGQTPGYQVVSKLIEKLKCKKLIRVKGNLYMSTINLRNMLITKTWIINIKDVYYISILTMVIIILKKKEKK